MSNPTINWQGTSEDAGEQPVAQPADAPAEQPAAQPAQEPAEQPVAYPPYVAPEAPPKKKWIPWVVGGVILLLLSCCAGSLLVGRSLFKTALDNSTSLNESLDLLQNDDMQNPIDILETDPREDMLSQLKDAQDRLADEGIYLATISDTITLDGATFSAVELREGAVQSFDVLVTNNSRYTIEIPTANAAFSGLTITGEAPDYNWSEAANENPNSMLGSIPPGESYRVKITFTDTDMNFVESLMIGVRFSPALEGYDSILWVLN